MLRFRRLTIAALLAVSTPMQPVLAALAPAPSNEELAFRKGAGEQYVKFAQAVRERVLTPASCPFSPASIVMAVGTEPQALAAFVRGAIAYEPYAGVVRGAEGTLASKSGGDWDRAVLLQALLAEAGYKSRLKVIERTPEEAAAVVDAFLNRAAVIASWYAGANGGNIDPGEPTELVKQFAISGENRRIHAIREVGRVRRLVSESLDAAAHETPRLLDAIAPAAKPGQSFDNWRAQLLAGARQRIEVETDLGATPTVLSVAPDSTPVDAARLESAETLDAPPDEKLATIAIRLAFTVAEQDGSTGEPVTLLDRTLPLGAMFRQPVRLEIVPSDDAAAAKPAAAWTKADWFRFVGNFKQFQAILRVGDEWDGSKVFDLSGQLLDVAADGRVENASQIGRAIGQGFGGGFGLGGGGGAEKPAEPTARIDALVMTIELALPGEAPQTQQRLIYGKARGDGVTPVFTADLSATAGPVSPHATTWMLLDAVTRNAPLAARLVASTDPRRFEQAEDAKRLPMMLYDWQMMRLLAAQRLMAADAGLTFTGGPCIVLRNTHVTIDRAQQSVGTRHSMDVAFDDAMLLPRSADKADAAMRANVTLGVASTVLESALLRAIDPANGVRGAYAVFEEARAAGAPPVAIAADAGAAATVNPPPVVAWSLARNETGRALLFAHGNAPDAWWSMDPSTGRTIGRGDGGEGQSAMEYLQITKKNIDNLKCMVGLSNQILGGDSGGDQAKQWFLCMTGTDNPGSGHGIPGGIEGAIDPDQKLLNIGVGPLADALGGAKDLYDIMNNKDPILFTGR